MDRDEEEIRGLVAVTPPVGAAIEREAPTLTILSWLLARDANLLAPVAVKP